MKVHPEISPKLSEWIGRQRMFFVGTAPLDASGHINLSPKGGDSFRVLGPLEAAYLDYTGSGAETIAHLRENGRIVIMFCAFQGSPQIVRLHGRGVAYPLGDGRFAELSRHFPPNPGARAIIHISVDRVSDSCGYAVPLYDYNGPRDVLDKWADRKGPSGIQEYHRQKNQRSIDGLPALS